MYCMSTSTGQFLWLRMLDIELIDLQLSSLRAVCVSGDLFLMSVSSSGIRLLSMKLHWQQVKQQRNAKPAMHIVKVCTAARHGY